MTSQALRWGIVGTGVVSAAFARALAKVPGNTRYAIISRQQADAARFASAWGFAQALRLEPGVFAHPDIDVFYIAAPTSVHRDLCLQAIAARKPIVCEKPMATSTAQFLALQSAARDAGVFAMEGMWLRFNPLLARIREQLAQGACGDILGASMQIGYADARPDAAARRDPSSDALSDFGCYGFSIAHFLFGSPRRVLASGRTDAAGQTVEHATVVLEYPGFSFLLETSVLADTRNALEIVGSRARLAIPASVIDPYRLETTTYGGTGAGAVAKIGRRLQRVGSQLVDQLGALHPLRGSGFRHEIAEVAACLGAGLLESRINPLSATLAAHRIQQCARESLQAREWRTLDADQALH